MRVLNKADLTFKSTQIYKEAQYPYLENLDTIKQLIPIPAFLLKPLMKYTLSYEINNSGFINFMGQKQLYIFTG